ncbi:serine/threonine protein kinase [Tengunoibacter tsumagoiensis]|uniref:non-specific serine/threonine protein kinase n=1 Tax=Tengunoibacter tsumagoiensis TaxID=2014871 RepID=A0A401ZYZ0_9CHLR|nr:serine/threonine-protein kinase [Tengunoibacter tsumagoiensis]GCE12088.1 hypothetical protein KTT_19470 [Tengunoibacter tsumagoiensis]
MQDVKMTLQNGSVVQGRYRVEELLGKGGFGAVYLVRDTRLEGNVFALKEIVDASQRERESFTLEGELLKRLNHPSLPAVYRTFEDEKRRRAYILMDYIAGPNLEIVRKEMPEHRLSLSMVMGTMAPIIEAVSYLHHLEPPIVHRDIKPSNIIIPGTGEGAVLVDFGIAKEYDMDATTTAIRRCSPGYGAPEQYASGTNPQTDLYGLAATFYTLLTGEVPIDALYRMTQIGSKRGDPLQPVHEIMPDIPLFVSDALQRALSIRSEDRFATVEEFWQALQEKTIERIPLTPAVAPLAFPAQTQKRDLPVTTIITRRATEVIPVRRGKQSRMLLILLACLALLALLSGLVWGRGLLFSGMSAPQKGTAVVSAPSPHRTSTAGTKTPESKPTAIPTSVPTNTPSVEPTTVPTTVPTAVPTAVPTTPPASYPILAGGYGGTINDRYTDPATSVSMALQNVQQQSGTLSGYLLLGNGLLGSSNFTGTVGSDNSISFTVPSPGSGLLPLLFQGSVQSDRSISGTYCSYRGQGQCDKSAGGWGDWTVRPTA